MYLFGLWEQFWLFGVLWNTKSKVKWKDRQSVLSLHVIILFCETMFMTVTVCKNMYLAAAPIRMYWCWTLLWDPYPKCLVFVFFIRILLPCVLQCNLQENSKRECDDVIYWWLNSHLFLNFTHNGNHLLGMYSCWSCRIQSIQVSFLSRSYPFKHGLFLFLGIKYFFHVKKCAHNNLHGSPLCCDGSRKKVLNVMCFVSVLDLNNLILFDLVFCKFSFLNETSPLM